MSTLVPALSRPISEWRDKSRVQWSPGFKLLPEVTVVVLTITTLRIEVETGYARVCSG